MKLWQQEAWRTRAAAMRDIADELDALLEADGHPGSSGPMLLRLYGRDGSLRYEGRVPIGLPLHVEWPVGEDFYVAALSISTLDDE